MSARAWLEIYRSRSMAETDAPSHRRGAVSGRSAVGRSPTINSDGLGPSTSVTLWHGAWGARDNCSPAKKENKLACLKNVFQNTKLRAENPHFAEFMCKIEIVSTHNLLRRIFLAAVCRKITTFTPPPPLPPTCVRCYGVHAHCFGFWASRSSCYCCCCHYCYHRYY